MNADDDRPSRSASDYTHLPPRVRLEDAIATVDVEPLPDPQGGRNVDQHQALRDD